MSATLYSVAEIARMLAARIDRLAPEILPSGRRDGAEWRVGGLDGAPGRSLGVRLTGDKMGVWCDFASGEGGDALELVARARCGGDKAAALRWARGWLGLAAFQPGAARPAVPPARLPRPANHAEASERRRKAALRLFLEARADIVGSPVAAYLAARAIHLAELGREPRALRWHPALEHPETCEVDHEGRKRWGTGRAFPAMVAAITDGRGVHVGTHRTWLAPGPDGRMGKAAVGNPKMTLGAWRGGAINLWRGASRKPLREAPEGDVLAIAEGIEDALTVALAYPEWRILAAISVGNLAALSLPPTLRDIVLVGQRDGENSAVLRAREAAFARWHSEGRAVRVLRPPEGHKDFNDWLQAAERGRA